MKKLLVMMFTLVIAACSDSYDNYVGHWSEQDGSGILSIVKEDSKTYLLTRDILNEAQKEEYVLEKNSNGHFEITIAFFGVGKMPVMISEDGKTLRIDNRAYTKIDPSKVDAAIQNAHDCKALSSDYLEEYRKTSYRDEEKRQAIKADYTQKQQSIPNCNIGNYVYTF